jgi:hypothetical protein
VLRPPRRSAELDGDGEDRSIRVRLTLALDGGDGRTKAAADAR